MEALIILAALVAIIGITSLAIVLVNKDSKALKAIGIVCFVPLVFVSFDVCSAAATNGEFCFRIVCCLMMLFAAITIASDVLAEMG